MLESGISRTDIFLTTKMWNDEQGYDATLFTFEQSLKRLQTDYLDMYLIQNLIETTQIAYLANFRPFLICLNRWKTIS